MSTLLQLNSNELLLHEYEMLCDERDFIESTIDYYCDDEGKKEAKKRLREIEKTLNILRLKGAFKNA